jgi:hypothetical protein
MPHDSKSNSSLAVRFQSGRGCRLRRNPDSCDMAIPFITIPDSPLPRSPSPIFSHPWQSPSPLPRAAACRGALSPVFHVLPNSKRADSFRVDFSPVLHLPSAPQRAPVAPRGLLRIRKQSLIGPRVRPIQARPESQIDHGPRNTPIPSVPRMLFNLHILTNQLQINKPIKCLCVLSEHELP